MNGRIYDPLLAIFLSPDNFVKSADLTQNLNRYSYCLNNPLIYTDPSGNDRTPVPYLLDSPYTEFSDIASGKAFSHGYSAAREQLGLHTAGLTYSQISIIKEMSSLWNSTYGGTWSNNSGSTYFNSDAKSFIAGCVYNEINNSWRYTSAGGWDATIANYTDIISQQSMSASVDKGGPLAGLNEMNSYLHALKQYLALVNGECGGDKKSYEEAGGIGCVIRNILTWTKQEFEGDILSKIGGSTYFQAALGNGNDPYRAILNSSFDEIFSTSNEYNQAISGAMTVFCSMNDQSLGAYFFSSGMAPGDTNWKAYNKCIFSITIQIGKFTFFKYTNNNKHWR